MKVKELIEELKKYPENTEVYHTTGDDYVDRYLTNKINLGYIKDGCFYEKKYDDMSFYYKENDITDELYGIDINKMNKIVLKDVLVL